MNLSEQVREHMFRQLLDGTLKPGDPIPAERELSKSLAVSRVTVRRAYEELSEAGILKKFRGKGGTRIAETFQGNAAASPLVAVIATLRDRFSREFIEALQQQSLAHDLLAVLAVTPEDTKEQNAMALRMAARGIRNLVIWGFDRSLDFQLFARLRILGVNQVFFDRVRPTGSYADYVGLDNARAVSDLLDAAQKHGSFDRIVGVDASGLDVDSNTERSLALEREAKKRRLALEWAKLSWRNPAENTLPEQRWDHQICFAVNDDLALRVAPNLPLGARLYSIDGTPEAARRGIVSCRQNMDELAGLVVESLLKQQRSGSRWRAGERRAKGEIIPC